MMMRIAGGLLLLVAAQGAAARVAPAAEQMVPGRFDCDGITYTGMLDARIMAELKPAHSLEAVAAILHRHNVPFTRNRGILDVPAMPSRMLAEINELPQGEPFVVPQGDKGVFCVLVPSAGSV